MEANWEWHTCGGLIVEIDSDLGFPIPSYEKTLQKNYNENYVKNINIYILLHINIEERATIKQVQNFKYLDVTLNKTNA